MVLPLPLQLSAAAFAPEGKAVLHPLTLSLSQSRIGLIGRNGSGKTTLLRLMAGLVSPTSGTVRLGQIDPAVDRKTALSQLGILFQNPDHQILFPTVAEELEFGLRQQGLSHSQAAARISALLQDEGRSHWSAAPTHTLSQGQRQYLCLLAILAMQPAWLLLDEPFAALDLPTRLRLQRRLAALPQNLVMVSHDPEVLLHCDRILWLEQGEIRADGPPATVLPAFRLAMEVLAAQDADTALP